MSVSTKKPILIELTPEMKEEILEMMKDYESFGETHYVNQFGNFEALIENLERYQTGINLPEDSVGFNMFFLQDKGKIIGTGSLRHKLNQRLAVYGGHIGYSVRPSERRKGYGSLILQLLKEKARKFGFERVFITCDTDNAASAKIIEKNGGKLANQMIYEQKFISQYWLEL